MYSDLSPREKAIIADNQNLGSLLSMVGEDRSIASGIKELFSVARSRDVRGFKDFLKERLGMPVRYELSVDDIACLISLYNPAVSEVEARFRVVKAISGRVRYTRIMHDRFIELHVDENEFLSNGKIYLDSKPYNH